MQVSGCFSCELLGLVSTHSNWLSNAECVKIAVTYMYFVDDRSRFGVSLFCVPIVLFFSSYLQISLVISPMEAAFLRVFFFLSCGSVCYWA